MANEFQHREKLKEVQNLQPELPSTLLAELRDYQMEGFCWLARLAHWGVGGMALRKAETEFEIT